MIVLIVVLIGVAIPFLMAIFMPGKYTIERDIMIDKPKADVFNYIKLLKNQDHYNKWVMMDPAMKKTFIGVDGTAGFIYAWDSENKQAGKGEQELTKIDGQHKIEIELRFEKPFKGKAGAALETEPVSPTQTHVKWVFTGERTYMMRVMHILLNLKKVLGKDIQTSLDTLKSVLEKQ